MQASTLPANENSQDDYEIIVTHNNFVAADFSMF
jgi:hypothetical protein